jgi:3-hydroxyisobutyrate dehydrogenase
VSTEPFGFIGLGAMGGPMIEKAIEAGLTVHVFDTNQAALDSAAKLGAKIEKSAAGVASAVEVVFVSLPNAPIVEAVALGPDGIIEALASNTTSISRRPARRSP